MDATFGEGFCRNVAGVGTEMDILIAALKPVKAKHLSDRERPTNGRNSLNFLIKAKVMRSLGLLTLDVDDFRKTPLLHPFFLNAIHKQHSMLEKYFNLSWIR